MQPAVSDNFFAAYDALKTKTRGAVGNIFQDRYELSALLESKNCLQFTTEDSLFLLIPTHNMYYDCLFMSKDKDNLEASLAKLSAKIDNAGIMSIRCSLIGKEPLTGELSQVFEKKGFRLIKKLLRMKLAEPEAKILDAMRPYAEEFRDHISFGREDDAEEVLSILLESFDPAGDNLPELEDIRKHLAQKNVVVLRQDGKIVSLHYFLIRHNTLHALYDVTRKEYRGGNGFFMALAVFVHDYFLARGKRCARVLGWRDVSRQKLLKHARKSSQVPDGVVIYNMLRTPDGAQTGQPETRP